MVVVRSYLKVAWLMVGQLLSTAVCGDVIISLIWSPQLLVTSRVRSNHLRLMVAVCWLTVDHVQDLVVLLDCNWSVWEKCEGELRFWESGRSSRLVMQCNVCSRHGVFGLFESYVMLRFVV
jgi:hypothetical protein